MRIFVKKHDVQKTNSTSVLLRAVTLVGRQHILLSNMPLPIIINPTFFFTLPKITGNSC